MSRVEEFEPDADRDLRPLMRALEPHGAALTLATWAAARGAVSVRVHLPDDEYRERKCRQLIQQWQAGALSNQS